MSEEYFVRIRGRVQGPFDTEKLQQMIRRGRLSRIHELSADRSIWLPASEIAGLFSEPRPVAAGMPAVEPVARLMAAPAAPACQPTPSLERSVDRGRPARGSNTALLAGAIGGLGVLGLTVGLIFFFKSSNSGPPKAEPAASTPDRRERAHRGDTGKPRQPALPVKPAARPADGRYVDASTPADDLADSLGLVVVGFLMKSPQGKITEKMGFVLDGKTIAGGNGTGFVITHDGYLLTNRHVIRLAQDWSNAQGPRQRVQAQGWEIEARIWVFVKDAKYVARLVHTSERLDIALLKLDQQFDRVFRLSRKARPARDTAVRALGYPGAANIPLSHRELALDMTRKRQATRIEEFYTARYREFVLTRGTVSREFEHESNLWIQHGAQIHGGNSGGPLIDQNGVVIGINTKAHPSAAGISMALSMPQMKAEIERFTNKVRWVDP